MSQSPATPAATLAAGQAHHAAGRLAEAEAAYRAVLGAVPGQPDALHLMGVIALQVGKPAIAVELIGQAIRGNPRAAGFHANLCAALRRLGRLEEAAEAGRRAVDLDPTLADGFHNLANALADLDRHAEAAEALKTLLALRPQLTDQRLQRARALILADRPADAVEELDALLAREPRRADAYINMGVALKKLGRVADAIAAYRTALEIAPDDPGALNNLGTALQEEDRYEEAADCFRQAIAAKPESGDAYVNLGLALRALGRVDEALEAARQGADRNPGQAEARTGLGFLLLLKGDLEAGFREYEWRTRMADFPSPRRHFSIPAWDGGDCAGRTILVHDEQGVGDAIQFIRYAPLLKARGARVVVECNTQLTRLLSSMPGVDAVIGRFTQPPPVDAYVSLLSLPHLLGTTPETVPAEVPYLFAEPELAARWGERLGPRRGLRVGLVWAGNPEFKDDRNRSPGLAAFRPLLDVPGVEVYALQKGNGRRDLETWPEPLPPNFTDLGPEIGNFADTAAAMRHLDLVISSCTGPTHLAGALGRPTWTVLPMACDWRWLDHGDTTVWYPTMRLFRQERRGEWGPVVERVRTALEEAVRTHGAGGRP